MRAKLCNLVTIILVIVIFPKPNHMIQNLQVNQRRNVAGEALDLDPSEGDLEVAEIKELLL